MFCSGCACVCSPLRFLKALSFASLDKEDLLSPINHSTLHRSSSVRSMVSSATFGCSEDYIGLALPLDINNMFQVHFVVSSPCNASVESGADLTDRRDKRLLRAPGNRETYLANAPVRAARYIACDSHAYLFSEDGSVISRKFPSAVFKWSACDGEREIA